MLTEWEGQVQTRRILRIELTVRDLDQAQRFYIDGLGFKFSHRGYIDPILANLLGSEKIDSVELYRGNQLLCLQSFAAIGAPYPPDATSCDQVFQHFAIPTGDIYASYRHLQTFGPEEISKSPQRLPVQSGGAIAFKFRDLDGHPLELIQFADGRYDGIDHSAIVVVDVERSIAFYRDHMGFELSKRQTNTGPEQDHLDHLSNSVVDVVALRTHASTPHLELLAYQHPVIRESTQLLPHDVAATRIVLEVDELPLEAVRLQDNSRVMLIHDPDKHALLLVSKT